MEGATLIYIYCKSKSTGARLLAERLRLMGAEAKRIRTYTEGAVVWGAGGGNKFAELHYLATAGIPVPLHISAMAFATPGVIWLARTFHHTQARDLLHPGRGDFYVAKVDTVREHRIHVYEGKVIRVQTKEAEPGAHPWIRSASSGWTLKARPDLTALLPPGARELAKKAIKAMDYKLGAVDLAVKLDGKLIVWEVNSRPGLNEQTADAYAAAILGGTRGRA